MIMTLQKYFKLYNFSFLIIIILHLAFIIYGDSFKYPLFIFDDNDHYTKSLSFFNKSFLSLIIEDKTAMPVFYKAWSLLNYFQPIYHVLILRITNLLLHISNSVLFYYIFVTLLKQKPKHLFFLASILFFIHPLQVESVVWLSSIKGTLALFLGLTSWCFYIMHEKRLKYLFYPLSLFLFLLALLCKVTIAPLPMAILITHGYFLNQGKEKEKMSIKSHLLRLLPFFFVAFASILYQVWTYDPGFHHHVLWHLKEIFIEKDGYFFVITAALILLTLINVKQFRVSFNKNKLRYVSLLIAGLITPLVFIYGPFLYLKIKNLISIFYFSLYKFLWPLSYSLDYSVNQIKINEFTSATLLITLILFSLYIFYVAKTKFRVLLALTFLLSIPYLGLTDFHFAKVSFFADRFIYISIYPLIIALVLILDKAPKKVMISLALLISVLLTFKSHKNALLWNNNETLLTHTLKQNSQSLISRMALASHYQKNDDIKQALEQYFKLTIIHPNYAQSYLSQIRLLIDIKQSDKAITHALLVLKTLKNIDPIIFSLMGEAFYKLEKYEIAKIHLEKAIKLGVRNSSTDLFKDAVLKTQGKK